MSLNRLALGRRLGVRARDLPGLVPGGFSPLPHAGHETSEADTHVGALGAVLSDAGSTPAASTLRPPFGGASSWQRCLSCQVTSAPRKALRVRSREQRRSADYLRGLAPWPR